jgi:hypothetical protein
VRNFDALGQRIAGRRRADAPPRGATAPPPARRRPMSRRLARFVDGFAAELSAAAARRGSRRR